MAVSEVKQTLRVVTLAWRTLIIARPVQAATSGGDLMRRPHAANRNQEPSSIVSSVACSVASARGRYRQR